MLLFVIILPLVLTLLYWNIKSKRQYWTKRGVQQNQNGFFLGDNWDHVTGKKSSSEMIQEAYNMFPNTRYSGFYNFLSPSLIIKDPELIKQITVKDFDHFVNHQNVVPEDSNSFLSNNLFSLKNQKWRDTRTTMSPAFTSSKMKYMFSLICQSGEQFVNHFLKKNEDIITVEMRDIFTRFTTDVIASIVFGVENNSLEIPNNEFYLRGKSLTTFSGIKVLKFMGNSICPTLCKAFKISPVSKIDSDFFANTILDNIKSREKHSIVRPDFLTVLLQAKKDGIEEEAHSSAHDTGFATVKDSELKKSKTKVKMTDMDIVFHATAFFFGGFESVSGVMGFTSYELGVNPDIQKKLIEEVDETLEACDGQLTYEALLGMKYMDMVVSESLRKWPNLSATDRVCTQTYVIDPKEPNEKPVRLETGSVVTLPIFALHRDPKYYPDPERFDPERFSDENKEKIVPYTYLPFGIGPRGCIGSRLALMETKVVLFYILSHFEIVPIEKTQIPIKISKRSQTTAAEDGFWFGLKRRSK